jgi:glucose/arabinose dehydrogenase
VHGCTAVAAVLVALLAPSARAATWPSGFETRTLAGGIRHAVDAAWAPDGRLFVASRLGEVYVVDGGERRKVVDISSHVNSYGDRGLEGIAVDSDFADNGYLWLLYVYEPDRDRRAASGPRTSRLTRVTIRGDGEASGETVVLGRSKHRRCPAPRNSSDCIPADNESHMVGTVRSASDGTLWVGAGDAADENIVDPLSLRAQDVKSYAGKILHVDRRGRGVRGHPYCRTHGGDGNLGRVCAKVYATGLRNPYRFTLRPGGGLIAGDVGWSTQEELDLVAAGRDYGWPCYEGGAGTAHGAKTPRWRDERACSGPHGMYSLKGRRAPRPPVYSYAHHGRTAAIIGGPRLPRDTAYPGSYAGRVFVADFTRGIVSTFDPDTRRAKRFATGVGAVDLELAPDGNVAYVDIGDEAVREIVRAPGR